MATIEVTQEDLELFRIVIAMARQYHMAKAVMTQAEYDLERPEFPQLVLDLSAALERADGLLKDALLAQHDAISDDEVLSEEEQDRLRETLEEFADVFKETDGEGISSREADEAE